MDPTADRGFPWGGADSGEPAAFLRLGRRWSAYERAGVRGIGHGPVCGDARCPARHGGINTEDALRAARLGPAAALPGIAAARRAGARDRRRQRTPEDDRVLARVGAAVQTRRIRDPAEHLPQCGNGEPNRLERRGTCVLAAEWAVDGRPSPPAPLPVRG